MKKFLLASALMLMGASAQAAQCLTTNDWNVVVRMNHLSPIFSQLNTQGNVITIWLSQDGTVWQATGTGTIKGQPVICLLDAGPYYEEEA